MTEKILGGQIPMTPAHAIRGDIISGGTILSEGDLCAAVVASSQLSQPDIAMVTRAMNEVEFKRQVRVGDVLSCYGSVTRLGTTSVTVDIDVQVRRRREIIQVTEATAIFVAIGADGKAQPIKPGAASAAPKQLIKPPSPLQLTPERGELVLRKVMMPNETNGMGNIFGGRLMSYLEWAGSTLAEQTCSNHNVEACVTRFMDKIEFREPVKVNDIVSCYGSVKRVGTTSIAVHIEVEANRRGVIIPVTCADLVLVAVDRWGNKIPVHSR